MRIGIDCRLWSQTGVGRYIRNLVINLEKIDKKNSYVLFVNSKEHDLIKKEIKNPNWKLVKTNSRWHSFSEQINFPKIISKENVDLMHFPYHVVPIFYKKPYVITIHDLIRHHFSTGQSSTLPYWFFGFKMLAYKVVINIASKNAKKVIAVSNFTKNEIIDHLVVNKNNVEVIYEAADDFQNLSSNSPNIKNYFLYVGNVFPHKNTDKLLKAFEILVKKSDAKLVFIGPKDYFYDRLKNQVKKFGDKIILVNNVSDQDLAGFYKDAICLIRPSLMEGFSLPPIEAMSCRCLVLASDIEVHREILKDSAIYFDPNSAMDIAEKMQYVLDLNKEKKEKLLDEGLKVSKEYSWEKTVRQTLNLYEGCAIAHLA